MTSFEVEKIIRCYCTSNFPSWKLTSANTFAELHGWSHGGLNYSMRFLIENMRESEKSEGRFPVQVTNWLQQKAGIISPLVGANLKI
ncbi:hypothetical protein RhiirA4_479409 [Rhizophagus irregularis]|uniref:Uncharacterized protein n=1 Tax=Rhizophagus irregularis TaxID=588596 RepID=A0A2I1HGE6_9GLOM|nr:hypothetical protein RhiirA4_479409 [Rhizophagus irregularis]